MKKLVSALVLATFIGGSVAAADADSIFGKILKAGAGGYAVNIVAKPLNNFINELLYKNGVPNREASKVVPILSVGDGTYIGAAQVVGSQPNVDATKAVLAVRSHFGGGGSWDVSALIPVNSLNTTGGLHRQYGVGLDAVINAKL